MTSTKLPSPEALPFLDVLSPEFGRNPEPMLRAVRSHHRIARSQIGYELLGFRECEQMYRDERITINFDKLMEVLGITSGPAYEHMSKQLIGMEGDAHRRIRRLITSAFSASAMEQLRTPAREILNLLLDAVKADGECDFVSQISDLFPARLFCRLIKAPEADAPALSRMNNSILKMFWMDPTYRSEIESAIDELGEYSRALIEQRRRALGSDFVSSLIRVEEDGDRLTTQEMVNLIRLVLTAAVDNVAQTMNLMMMLFIEHPESWALLRARPELIPRAVEECMRYRPRIVRFTAYASQDVTIGEVPISSGSWVVGVIAAANRDERVFKDPDRFDITREPMRPNLGFGTGRHVCIGLHLALIELQETLAALVRRWERFELAGQAVPLESNQVNAGMKRLQLRFSHV